MTRPTLITFCLLLSIGIARAVQDPRLERIAESPVMPAGIVVTDSGRTFVSFPKWGEPHDHTLMEYADGQWNGFPGPFTSIQGIVADKDRLYALDAGAAKLHVIDLNADKITRTYSFPPDVLGRSAYLNDLRIDPTRHVAYLSDSLGAGIIVLNLETGDAFRRLQHHDSSKPEKDLRRTVEGKPFTSSGNTDGIALSPDAATLYYSAFASRTIYAVPTADLSDRSVAEDDLDQKVRPVATKPSANDGLTTDAHGDIYSTDYEDQSIRVTTPAGQVKVLLQDDRLTWPDALWTHDGWLYITTNQLNRLPSLNAGKDLRVRPYSIYRYPLNK
jgi:sugar lactone lactonase YvrE